MLCIISVLQKNYLIDLDLDVHLDLFETGVTEACVSVSVGVDLCQHLNFSCAIIWQYPQA